MLLEEAEGTLLGKLLKINVNITDDFIIQVPDFF